MCVLTFVSPSHRLNSWFSEFDTNHNGSLERDELRKLLRHLHPDCPPDEAILDTLIEVRVRVSIGA